jgi:hypothetical protein
MKVLSWILSLIVAGILLQTLFFKFTGSAESLYIFEKTGLGDAGRFGSGIVELIASILVLIPRTRAIGALLAIGGMCGAIFFHLTSLGIEVQGDGGLLFYLALTVFICSAALLILHRSQIPLIGKGFTPKGAA